MKKSRLPLIVFVFFAVIMLSGSFIRFNRQGELPRSARTLYLQYCASCHGENLDRFAARKWVYGNAVKDVESTLKYGRPAIGMPEFGKAMSDTEINSLARYTIEKVAQVSEIIPTSFNDKDTIRSFDLDFVLHEIAGGGMRIPWGLVLLPNGDFLIAEKSGVLYLVSNGDMKPVEGLPRIFVRGQGGLMDVVIHPRFKENKLIYIAYADGEASNALNTSIGRGELVNGKLENFERIVKGVPGTNAGVHFGCRMIFNEEGYLYFTIGDRGMKENAQNLSNHCGKVHRVFDDGRIPPDNPFVTFPNAIGSIWSYGHRNPQGLVYDNKTGLVWSNEHGPKGGDELNLIKKGKNYGWPVVTFGINYDGTIITNDTTKTGVEPPVYYWIPSIAPSSLAVVSSPRYPGWKNDFLSGSLSYEYLERSIMKNNRVVATEKLLLKIGRVRHVVEASDGYIYIAVENPSKVYRIVPVK